MRLRQTSVAVFMVAVAFQANPGAAWAERGPVARAVATQNAVGPAAPARAAAITVDELKKLHAAGAVLVVDVRLAEVYRAGRIAAAISAPLAALDDRAAEIRTLAKGRPIVTYCSCPGDHASLAAAELLAAKGIAPVRVLAGGYPAWVLAGGKVDKD